MEPLPQAAQNIINVLQDAGHQAFAVGGSVRDTLMHRPTKGWDFTTDATPEEILALFPDSFYDNQFGTVGIKIYGDTEETNSKNQTNTKVTNSKNQIPNNEENDSSSKFQNPNIDEVSTIEAVKPVDIYEITTFRSEQGYTDNRHPDVIVWGKNLEEDLSRRDFTINAMAYDGKTLTDPYHGYDDLKQSLIRTVGNPRERFQEDALRIMRAVRIASQIGFFIEPETQQAITEFVEKLHTISAERVRDELFKLLSSNYPADGILLLKNTGILSIILPELDEAFKVPQKSPKRHHIYDVGTHSVMALKNCPSSDPLVRLATLLHDIGKVRTFHKDETGLITFFNHEVFSARLCKQIAYRLRLSKKETEKLLTLVRWHQFTVDERQTDSAIRRFIRHVGKDHLDDMLALRIGDRLGGGALETSWRLELFKKRLEDVQQQPFSVSDLKINGFDVMQTLDTKPGPIIGKILNALFAEVEAETLPNERELLLKRMVELKDSLS